MGLHVTVDKPDPDKDITRIVVTNKKGIKEYGLLMEEIIVLLGLILSALLYIAELYILSTGVLFKIFIMDLIPMWFMIKDYKKELQDKQDKQNESC